MTELEARAILRRYLTAMSRMDLDTVHEFLHRDHVLEHPQSGETIRGRDRVMAMLRAFPGGIPADSSDEEGTRIFADDDRWAVSPMLTPIRVVGSEGTYTTTVPIRYPDGTTWHLIAISEIRDGLIVRSIHYWAEAFPPAEWRAPFVESMPPSAETEPQPRDG